MTDKTIEVWVAVSPEGHPSDITTDTTEDGKRWLVMKWCSSPPERRPSEFDKLGWSIRPATLTIKDES
jgi:hypothetical protein